MSHVLERALTIAASHYVDASELKFDACELYPHLQELARQDDNLMASEISEFSVSADYQSLSVLELVRNIEVAANQMMEFGKVMLDAAHAGLVDAAIEGCLDSDANTWHLPTLAEGFI